MEIKILKTEEDYDEALSKADEIFDTIPGSSEGDELELLLWIIKDYEDRHHPVSLLTP